MSYINQVACSLYGHLLAFATPCIFLLIDVGYIILLLQDSNKPTENILYVLLLITVALLPIYSAIINYKYIFTIKGFKLYYDLTKDLNTNIYCLLLLYLSSIILIIPLLILSVTLFSTYYILIPIISIVLFCIINILIIIDAEIYFNKSYIDQKKLKKYKQITDVTDICNFDLTEIDPQNFRVLKNNRIIYRLF